MVSEHRVFLGRSVSGFLQSHAPHPQTLTVLHNVGKHIVHFHQNTGGEKTRSPVTEPETIQAVNETCLVITESITSSQSQTNSSPKSFMLDYLQARASLAKENDDLNTICQLNTG